MTTFKLSPSDLTFQWDECKRCFYLKVKHNFRRPPAPFPKIFGDLDRQMKDFCYDKSLSSLSPALGEGNVVFGEKWVQSAPIVLPGHTISTYILGKFDTVVQFSADQSYGVIDFKTSRVKPEHVDFYSRQLRAYAYALEHPAPGKLHLSPITRLGLLVFEPKYLDGQDDILHYGGKMTWQECPLDEPAFLAFLNDAFSLLEEPEPPPAAEDCAYCKYRDQARNLGF